MAHMRQSRPDYGLGFEVQVLTTFRLVPFSLGSGEEAHWHYRGTPIWDVYIQLLTGFGTYIHDSLRDRVVRGAGPFAFGAEVRAGPPRLAHPLVSGYTHDSHVQVWSLGRMVEGCGFTVWGVGVQYLESKARG